MLNRDKKQSTLTARTFINDINMLAYELHHHLATLPEVGPLEMVFTSEEQLQENHQRIQLGLALANLSLNCKLGRLDRLGETKDSYISYIGDHPLDMWHGSVVLFELINLRANYKVMRELQVVINQIPNLNLRLAIEPSSARDPALLVLVCMDHPLPMIEEHLLNYCRSHEQSVQIKEQGLLALDDALIEQLVRQDYGRYDDWAGNYVENTILARLVDSSVLLVLDNLRNHLKGGYDQTFSEVNLMELSTTKRRPTIARLVSQKIRQITHLEGYQLDWDSIDHPILTVIATKHKE